ncbi:MAG: endonuclease III [Candidatus Omnitrophica bacterium]|nr:endonuclease III [Candidatus Omnitrophota bacterium]
MTNSAKHSLSQRISALRSLYKNWRVPTVTEIAEETEDPFQVLVSTVISARTKDETTEQASRRLFKLAPDPRKMLTLKTREIERAIFPAGFYRTKARHILALCRTLVEKFGGRVPDTIEELVTLAGVGRKTANLVVTLAFGKPGICVDTHVHRISNRWGLVKTKSPAETEKALRKSLPRKYWITYNDLLVAFGQNLCRPLSPHCSRCPIEDSCAKVGVASAR